MTTPSVVRKRHGCLTAWLVLMLISNLVAVLANAGSASVRQYYPNAPGWAFPALIIVGILNIVFVIALFRWKKWGFWGCAATTVVAFVVNLLVGLNVLTAVIGLAGPLILFGILQIGGENKGWSQLE